MSRHKWFHIILSGLAWFLTMQALSFQKGQLELEKQIKTLNQKLAAPKTGVEHIKVKSMEESLVRDRKQSFEEIPAGQGNNANDLTQKIKKYNKIIVEADDHYEVEDFSGRSTRSKKEEKQYPITRICLTGGPCAGKTTALTELTIVLQQMGFRVLQVPEAATLMKKGGAL